MIGGVPRRLNLCKASSEIFRGAFKAPCNSSGGVVCTSQRRDRARNDARLRRIVEERSLPGVRWLAGESATCAMSEGCAIACARDNT